MRRVRPPSSAPGTSLCRGRRNLRLSPLPAPGPARRSRPDSVAALLQAGQEDAPDRSPVSDIIVTHTPNPIPRPSRTFLCINVLFNCKSGKYDSSHRGCTSHANPADGHRRGAQRGYCLWRIPPAGAAAHHAGERGSGPYLFRESFFGNAGRQSPVHSRRPGAEHRLRPVQTGHPRHGFQPHRRGGGRHQARRTTVG